VAQKRCLVVGILVEVSDGSKRNLKFQTATWPQVPRNDTRCVVFFLFFLHFNDLAALSGTDFAGANMSNFN
jgi:hypothetical protein